MNSFHTRPSLRKVLPGLLEARSRMPTHFTPSLVPRILVAYVGQQRLRRLDVQVRTSLASIAADILT